MARKKIEPIETLGRDTDKLIIQKSKPLFALWQSELTLAEFKILDTYLGRINSHDDEHRTVKFEKGELENLLGVKQLKPQVLDDRLQHLMTTVRIPDKNSKRGFTRIALFEKAHAEQDDYGVWEAELTCTESAKKYIFDVENLNYLRYKLKNIINIKSRYTYIMFLYLWENKYRGTWEEPLDKLKSILNCDNEEYCKQFKVFNDRVLKRVHKEIHEATDIKYDYETVKRGRSVVAIRFIYKSKTLEEVDENQMTLEQWQEEAVKEKELWQTPLEDFNFTQEQYDELFSVLITIPDFKLPQSSACYGSVELMRYHYIDQKAKEIKRRDTQKPIRSKFSYLLKLMKQDKPCCIGVLCRAYKGGNPYQSSFTADTGTYRVCADKVVCKRVQEVERVLLN